MKVEHYFENITGWFDFAEVYDIAVKESKDGDTIVETGTANGKSIVYLGVEAINSGKQLNIVTIDNTANESQVEYVKEQIAPLENVRYIHDDSIDVSESFGNNSLRMVFLDADHEYEFVRDEMAAWWPKVMRGGVLSGHDWQNGYPGIVQAVKEFMAKNKLKMKLYGCSWFIRKP